MTKARRRLLALACVAAVTSVAYGNVVVTPMTSTSGPLPINTPALLLYSVRNTGALPVTVNHILLPLTADCQTMSVTPFVPLPHALMPGEEFQFTVNATYSAATTTVCNLGVDTTPLSGAGFQAMFMTTSPGAEAVELQPSIMDFGQPAPSEQQMMILENFGGTQHFELQINNDAANAFSFIGCATSNDCSFDAGSGDTPLTIQCDTSSAGLHMANVTANVGAEGVVESMIMLKCVGNGLAGGSLDASPSPLVIATSLGVPATADEMVIAFNGADALVSADITGTDSPLFSIMHSGCQSVLMCDFSAAPLALPVTLTIGCDPDSNVSKSATLTMHGMNGITDTKAVTVTCDPNADQPIINFSTLTIDAGNTPVGSPSTAQTLIISNVGGAALTAQLQIPGSEWSADACVSTCTIPPTSSQMIHLVLTPTASGDRSVTMTVLSNDSSSPAVPIALDGTGVGGVLDVTVPASFAIDFGTIPLNQTSPSTVQMVDTGNANITVTIAPSGAPFTTDHASVPLGANNGNGSFVASCNSATAGTFSGSIALSSDASQANTASIALSCTVVDIPVTVTPTAFDFGEVRIGAAPVSMTVTVSNPTSSDVPLGHLQLDAMKAGLTLDPADTTTTLHATDSVMATLMLDPTSEVDLEGVHLTVAAGGQTLSLPIHGKVVTPSAHVTPAKLDLGTACIGSQVTGVVALVNDGTATLNPSAPMMDQSFTPLFESPTSYPTPLPPTFTALVGITPASSATGPLNGNLTWNVDVPNAPFVVPVSLVIVDSGAAVSPSDLDFGELEVNMVSDTRTITLENCSPTAVTLTTHGVTASQGGADAWQLVPPMETMLLAPRTPITVQVSFAPHQSGHYDASFVYDTDGTTGNVELVGDASGLPSPTSFYACSCSGGGDAPSRGWPIGAAVVLVSLRRRRR